MGQSWDMASITFKCFVGQDVNEEAGSSLPGPWSKRDGLGENLGNLCLTALQNFDH